MILRAVLFVKVVRRRLFIQACAKFLDAFVLLSQKKLVA